MIRGPDALRGRGSSGLHKHQERLSFFLSPGPPGSPRIRKNNYYGHVWGVRKRKAEPGASTHPHSSPAVLLLLLRRRRLHGSKKREASQGRSSHRRSRRQVGRRRAFAGPFAALPHSKQRAERMKGPTWRRGERVDRLPPDPPGRGRENHTFNQQNTLSPNSHLFCRQKACRPGDPPEGAQAKKLDDVTGAAVNRKCLRRKRMIITSLENTFSGHTWID